MTNPSLIKRLEAIESVQVPHTPICLWEPYDPTRSQQAAFEAQLAATKAAHPHRPIMVIGWSAAA
jgi:hypothetical protein